MVAACGPSPAVDYALVTVGTRRIRVNAWLPDDPYPLADVDDWPDPDPDDPDTAGPRGELSGAAAAGPRSGGGAGRGAGDRRRAGSDDPLVARYQLCGAAPRSGPRTGYRLLCAASPAAARPARRGARRRRGDASVPAALTHGAVPTRPAVVGSRGQRVPSDDRSRAGSDPSPASSTSSRRTPSRRRSGRSRAPGDGSATGRPARCVGLGLVLVLLGLLRLVQTEWDRSAEGSLSWLAYLIVLVVCVACPAVSRINKDTPEQGTEGLMAKQRDHAADEDHPRRPRAASSASSRRASRTRSTTQDHAHHRRRRSAAC